MKVPLEFYQREDVVQISKELLGKYLFTRDDQGQVTGGMIVETEAYRGAEDKACHAYKNRRTRRTEVMFHDGGIAYVYLCYGMHHLFNIVTYCEGIPHAVLIRAIEPHEGFAIMKMRRKANTPLATGPGCLTQALGINASHNGISLLGDRIWVEDKNISPDEIVATPRIGVAYAQEDALLPYRFVIKNIL